MAGHEYKIGDMVIFVEDAFGGIIPKGSVVRVVGLTGKPFTLWRSRQLIVSH